MSRVARPPVTGLMKVAVVESDWLLALLGSERTVTLVALHRSPLLLGNLVVVMGFEGDGGGRGLARLLAVDGSEVVELLGVYYLTGASRRVPCCLITKLNINVCLVEKKINFML